MASSSQQDARGRTILLKLAHADAALLADLERSTGDSASQLLREALRQHHTYLAVVRLNRPEAPHAK